MDDMDVAIPAPAWLQDILEGRSVWAQNHRRRAKAIIAFDAGCTVLMDAWSDRTDEADEGKLMKAISRLRLSLGR